MNNHKWPVSILLAMLPLFGALSGCGGGSSTAPISTPSGGTNTTASTGVTNTTTSSGGSTSPSSGSATTPLPVVKLDILASNISGHPNDGIDVFNAASGMGFSDQNVFSITSGASDNDLLAKDSSGTFYVQDYDVYPPTIYTVTGGTKKALPRLPPTGSYPSSAAAMTTLPSGHLIAAAYTVSFGYNGFTTLQTDGTWSAYQLKNQYSIVRAMTVGTDGKLYVSGRQNGTERVDRYAVSGDTLTFETTLLTASGSSQFGAIGLARNGDMILADVVNHQLQAFTTSGGTTSKVFPLLNLGRFVVAHSVLKQNDEVLFVIGRNGLYRVDYTSGDFKAVDQDSAQNPKVFLPFPNGGTFKDLTLN